MPACQQDTAEIIILKQFSNPFQTNLYYAMNTVKTEKVRFFIMAKSKLVKANKKIAQEVVGGYKKVEETVVGGYKKIEDAFVDRYLTREGESIRDAKARLQAEQEERQAKRQERRESQTEQTMEHVKRAQEHTRVSGRTK